MPGAPDVPRIEVAFLQTPSPWTAHGVKGGGEGGRMIAPPAVTRAVEDALRPFGARIDELPISMETVVRRVRGLTRVLDPQVKALLAAARPPFEEMTVPQARQAALAFTDLQGPGPEVASVAHRFSGATADLPVRIYTPEGEARAGDRLLPRQWLGDPQHRGVRP